MLANPIWQKIALLLNLLGTIILFYSFQATSSDFRLVTAPPSAIPPPPPTVLGKAPRKTSAGKQYALCVNNYTLLASDASSGVFLGANGCPAWQDAKPAAVVNIEHPRFAGIGFFMLVLGFGLQYFAIPKPATIAYLRAELKKAQLLQKLNRKRQGLP